MKKFDPQAIPNRWLMEWRIFQALSQNIRRDKPRLPPEGEAAPGTPRDFAPPADRQIRLLHPLGALSRSRPLYVAVLNRTEDGGWLCAPFSRFSEPAVDGELATRLKPNPLRVLQAWNARDLSAAQLQWSWVCGRIPDQLAARAVRAIERRADRVREGARPEHPADPRWIYLQEESEWADFPPPAVMPDSRICRYDATPKPALKAAENNEAYGPATKTGRKRRTRSQS